MAEYVRSLVPCSLLEINRNDPEDFALENIVGKSQVAVNLGTKTSNNEEIASACATTPCQIIVLHAPPKNMTTKCEGLCLIFVAFK